MQRNLLFPHVLIKVNNVYDAASAKQWPLQLQTVATASTFPVTYVFHSLASPRTDPSDEHDRLFAEKRL